MTSTSMQKSYESNQVRQYTQADEQQFAEARKGLVPARLDLDGAGADHNVSLIGEFFERNRNLPVTVQNVYRAVEERKNEFKWLSRAQYEYQKIAVENVQAAQQLIAWLDTQGKPGQLVNQGDQAYENLTLLLIELRGRPVDTQRIHEAMGRISFKPGRQLHFIPEPPKQDPRQHQSDGTGFLGTNVNEPRWKRIQREREEREAADRAKQPGAAQSVKVREAKRRAEELRGNTHSEAEQLRRMFVTIPGTSEIDWLSTETARLNLQKSLSRAQQVRRFIR